MPASLKRTAKTRRAWIITDGSAGMEIQAAGVAQALGADIAIKRVRPRGPWRWLAPWGPIDPRERFGREDSQFAPPWPDIAVACGRLSIPAIRAVRKASPDTYTVVIPDPRAGAGIADLIAVPAHDKPTGDNVIHTLTAPHGFSQQRLARLRRKMPKDIAALPAPRVAVILGGPNAVYGFSIEDSARLGGSLASMAALGASFLITVSRRSPPYVLDAIRKATQHAKRIVWDGKGTNPYENWLAHADIFVVTADSVNMTGEACATGKPVYVFEPDGGSAKFNRFHEGLRRYGATRRLPETFSQLETWAYPPLDSTPQIATEIEKRWREKMQAMRHRPNDMKTGTRQ
ncbi:MAG: mitochondrial fission ELM1 family protein [Proteobacteria bacterium]|nr:mitochondrial fission ELM1 family protein [Pseudomonadota bacterium]